MIEINKDENYKEMVIIKGLINNDKFARLAFPNIIDDYFDDMGIAKLFNALKNYWQKTDRILDKDTLLDRISEDKEDVAEAIRNIDDITLDTVKHEKELVQIATEWIKRGKQRRLLMNFGDSFNPDSPRDFNIQEVKEFESTFTWSLSGSEIPLSVSFTDFCDIDFGPIEWFMFPIVSESDIILLAGDRGVGKSMFTMHLAHKISTGRNFGPWVHGNASPINVLYVDGEMFYKTLQDRMKDLPNTSHFRTICRTYLESQTPDIKCLLTDENFRELIRDEIEKHNIKFVIFDNISSLTIGISENVSEDWDPVNQFLLSLRSMGVTSLIVHHTGKSGLQRGTSGREDNVSTIILMHHPKNYAADQGLKADFTITKYRAAVDDSSRDMLRSRELSFKDNEWQFDVQDLGESKEFMLDVLRGKTNVEISTIYETSPMTVSRRINKLETDGLIIISGNNRNRNIEVTDKGKEYLGELWERNREYLDLE